MFRRRFKLVDLVDDPHILRNRQPVFSRDLRHVVASVFEVKKRTNTVGKAEHHRVCQPRAKNTDGSRAMHDDLLHNIRRHQFVGKYVNEHKLVHSSVDSLQVESII